ncbi:UDP-N-acetylmuramate--L-alanine ligase, partial [Candidatus Sumerlaeota bacterium]|nr:UDP-N-acetylmuramate--L-alanine ligase [Candidatus Sumerlaeota bacterium]
AENIEGAQLVVTSSAIRPENPERRAAEAAGIPTWRRARVLGEIMQSGRGIAISGTHGKTTTTAMISLALVESNFDPTCLIGGELEAFGGNARVGKGDWIVAEADESDGSFVDLAPERIIVTNIEADHMDYYRDMDHLMRTFADFLKRLKPGGKVIACADSGRVMDLVTHEEYGHRGQVLTYGITNQRADLVAKDIRYMSKSARTRFTAVLRGKPLGVVSLRIPGKQNVSNAMATLLTAMDIGCPFEAVARALGNYAGTKRRYQVKGVTNGITIIDDYAHHPTEIKATLAAARSSVRTAKGRRIVGVFQPHRYSRTANLAHEFGGAFREADMIVVTDVYAAGEDPIEGVSGNNIYAQVVADGHPAVYYIPRTTDVSDFLRSKLSAGDMVFTLGAGDVWRLGESLLEDLKNNDKPPLAA